MWACGIVVATVVDTATRIASVSTSVDINASPLMESQIKQWGHSAAVRLSKRILAQANLDISDRIDMTVEDGRIVIQPVERARQRIKLPFSERDLLKGLDRRTAHADEAADLMEDELPD